MPRTKRAPGKRARSAAKPKEPILDLAKAMHVPMHEAQDIVAALELAGLGITELGSDHGAAVTTLARAASTRLETVNDLVIDLIQLAHDFEEKAGLSQWP